MVFTVDMAYNVDMVYTIEMREMSHLVISILEHRLLKTITRLYSSLVADLMKKLPCTKYLHLVN